MDADQVAAFRLARQGLDARRPLDLAAAAGCPASDFQRGSALLALAARAGGVTREGFATAVDEGDEIVIAPSLRAAIHALAAADLPLFGRALIVRDDDAGLGEQLGRQAQGQLAEAGIPPSAALAEVTEATAGALAGGGALTKDDLHEELRGRVRAALLPWCESCGSHHVAPMLWRFAGVNAGVRLDSRRRYVAGAPRVAAPADAVRRFLRAYGPATVKDFIGWAGVAKAHGRRLWEAVAGELAEVRVGGRTLWLLAADEPALAAPPQPRGLRLLPPRDPYLQHPDRAWIARDPAVRKRLFRPVAAPGAVLQDGRLAGLWRVRARGRRAEVAVEALGPPIDRDALGAEAVRVAVLRGARDAIVTPAG